MSWLQEVFSTPPHHTFHLVCNPLTQLMHLYGSLILSLKQKCACVCFVGTQSSIFLSHVPKLTERKNIMRTLALDTEKPIWRNSCGRVSPSWIRLLFRFGSCKSKKNSLNDSRDLEDFEIASSSGSIHVPSQPLIVFRVLWASFAATVARSLVHGI